MIVYGVNPVVEVLSARPETVEALLLAEGARVHDLDRLYDLARRAGVRVQRVPRERIAKLAPGAVHQGVLAQVAEASYAEPEELVARATGVGEAPLVLALDQVQDPIHLGACTRSAHAFGAHGVLVPKDRSASLTAAAVKASAGATARLPIARATNLARALEQLKESGLWVIGADMAGEACDRVDLTGPLCVVIGSEGKGLRPVIEKACDRIVSIPMRGAGVGSLSASAAASVLLYEVDRQRRNAAAKSSDSERDSNRPPAGGHRA